MLPRIILIVHAFVLHAGMLRISRAFVIINRAVDIIVGLLLGVTLPVSAAPTNLRQHRLLYTRPRLRACAVPVRATNPSANSITSRRLDLAPS
jgi:hypothetical protein